MPTTNFKQISKTLRGHILSSTTTAKSGHPTSSLSATDLISVLFGGEFFKADIANPENVNNDRLIFSKGHASPLFYSLYTILGVIRNEELQTLRQFESRLEGHPTMNFPYTEAATGSLGQGLGIGVGMALNARMEKLNYRTFILMGDSEMAEGSIWESMQLAAHYKLNNLIGIIDVNSLGQRGETMYGYDLENYQKKCEAFGFETFVIDGHNFDEIEAVFKKIEEKSSNKDVENENTSNEKPIMIIAKTIKGAGISFLENAEDWHGKALNKEQLKQALLELGDIDSNLQIQIPKPEAQPNSDLPLKISLSPALTTSLIANYQLGEFISTRKAYGKTLAELGNIYPEIVVLDAETSNSTFANLFKKDFSDRFFEMYIAEQNMVSTSLGLSRRGKIPFISTFAAFFTRAFDQIRMSQYSNSNIKFIGSHAGVSIGEDGSSQMALEDLAMFRAVSKMVVLYPCDAISCAKLVEQAAIHVGNVYIRITRADTPVIYKLHEEFEIGGSKTVKISENDQITIITAGITVHEAVKAYQILQAQNISIRIIDLYSIKPFDKNAIIKACAQTKALIVVEDHYPEGGIYEAICGSGVITKPVHHLAVSKMPRSGKMEELLAYEEIDAAAIVKKVKEII